MYCEMPCDFTGVGVGTITPKMRYKCQIPVRQLLKMNSFGSPTFDIKGIILASLFVKHTKFRAHWPLSHAKTFKSQFTTEFIPRCLIEILLFYFFQRNHSKDWTEVSAHQLQVGSNNIFVCKSLSHTCTHAFSLYHQRRHVEDSAQRLAPLPDFYDLRNKNIIILLFHISSSSNEILLGWPLYMTLSLSHPFLPNPTMLIFCQ